MKKLTYFGHAIPTNIFGRSLINLSPLLEGGTIDFSNDQLQEVQAHIAAKLEEGKPTLQNCIKFITNAGGKAYLSTKEFETEVEGTLNSILSERIENPNDLQKTVLKFKSSLIGESLTPVDSTIKEITGIEKNDNEKTRDYAKRAFDAISKEGKIDEGTFNALKGKLEAANKATEKLQKDYDTLSTNQLKSTQNSLIEKGIPANLNYSPEELKVILPGVKAQIDSTYEFKHDETGSYAIDKRTKEPQLDQQGNRKSIESVVSEYVGKLPGLKFKEAPGGGAPVPGAPPANMSAEQTQAAEKVWADKLAEKNLIGHEKDAFVLRKELNLSVPAKAVEKWPELK